MLLQKKSSCVFSYGNDIAQGGRGQLVTIEPWVQPWLTICKIHGRWSEYWNQVLMRQFSPNNHHCTIATCSSCPLRWPDNTLLHPLLPQIIITPQLLCTNPAPSYDQITHYYVLCFPQIIIIRPLLHTHLAVWGDQATHHFLGFKLGAASLWSST